MKHESARAFVFLVVVTLIALGSCSENVAVIRDDCPADSVAKAPAIIRQIPHDINAFTQGLLYHQGYLYESTGKNGQSSVRRLDLWSGSILDIVNLAFVDFGEGLALKNNQLVQLTWISQKAYVYSLPGIVKTDTLFYSGYGWGLTSDGTSYIMSNGSDTLYYRDDAFRITRKLSVTRNGAPLVNLNELEYANNKIYSNVWHNDSIFIINPLSGEVAGIVDCTSLVSIINPIDPEDVLNGIAYNDSSGAFYLTGKRWPYIFEVDIPCE